MFIALKHLTPIGVKNPKPMGRVPVHKHHTPLRVETDALPG